MVEVDITAEVNASIIDRAITDALDERRALAAAPSLPVVPDGTITTAQLWTALRILRSEVQATRAGAQRVAATLAQITRSAWSGVTSTTSTDRRH